MRGDLGARVLDRIHRRSTGPDLPHHGPPGTKTITDHLTAAFAEDISTRMADEHDPAAGIAFETHEIAPGLAFDRDGIKVYAFVNDHGDLVKPSYGYRITYGGHTVVLAGDTRFSAAVVATADRSPWDATC